MCKRGGKKYLSKRITQARRLQTTIPIIEQFLTCGSITRHEYTDENIIIHPRNLQWFKVAVHNRWPVGHQDTIIFIHNNLLYLMIECLLFNTSKITFRILQWKNTFRQKGCEALAYVH